MHHCAWLEVAWLPDVMWPKLTSREVKWRHKTESGWFHLGYDLICSKCCVVLQVCFLSRPSVLAVVFPLNNLRVKWMKWYIWSPKSPNRRSLCIYPGLWLDLYRGWINLLFFHNTCLTSNNTNFWTMPVASRGFSKNLVTSVMLCPAHRWMR